MKRIYCLAVLFTLLILGSCTREEGGGNTEMAVTSESFIVPVEQAIDELNQFLDIIDPPTRSERRAVADIKTWNDFKATRSDGTEDAPLFYIVNFADNEGFAILSGDSRITPVLAVTEEGYLDIEEGVDNPGLALFLEYLELGVSNGSIFDPDTSTGLGSNPDAATTVGTIAPLPAYTVAGPWYTVTTIEKPVNALWHQSAPFNEKCSTKAGNPAKVGCGAIAVGLMMSYWKHDFDIYAWQGYMEHIIYGDEEDRFHELKLVQTLLSSLGSGRNLNMDYGVHSSGCDMDNIPRTFRNFGYRQGGDILHYDKNTIATYLKNGPVIARGRSNKEEFLGIVWYTDGHLWVIDKYMDQERKIVKISNSTGQVVSTTYGRRSFVHCNWGWGGTNNGYYYNGVFNAAAGAVDTTKGGETRSDQDYNYQYYLRMIVNIKP